MLRGKVGAATYSIGKDGDGKKQQIVRALPESVSNPQTIAQVLQRMKLAPAQKFYSALSEILSNSYEGVQYGEQSRLEFLRLAMTETGPYIQKGVDRFIPAEYQISSGSLPEVQILDFSAGATTIETTVSAIGADATGVAFAAALGVSEDSQITILTVTNNGGVFIPHYTPFDKRFQLNNVPAGLFTISSGASPVFVINPTAANLATSNMVACAVIISVQDASGSWLRSPQKLQLNNELYAELYGNDAMTAAIASYQDTATVNAINSAWYLNLGLNQAWNGRLVSQVMRTGSGATFEVLVGLRQESGRLARYIFTEDGADTSTVFVVRNGNVSNVGAPTAIDLQAVSANGVLSLDVWNDSMASQAGLTMGEVAQDELPTASGYYYVDAELDMANYPVVKISAGDTPTYEAVTPSGGEGCFIYENGAVAVDENAALSALKRQIADYIFEKYSVTVEVGNTAAEQSAVSIIGAI